MTPSPPRQLLQRADFGDVTVITFTESTIVEEPKIQAIGEQLFKLVEQLGRKHLVLNFGNVDYLSSHMLAKAVTLFKKLRAVGGKLILCDLKPEIYANLTTTNLHKIFEIRSSAELGLDAPPSRAPAATFRPPGADANAPD